MKCPECQQAGERSTVYPGMTTVTCAYYAPYYDEDGRFHHHDNNVIESECHCSRGHKWTKRDRAPCPTCGDDWR